MSGRANPLGEGAGAAIPSRHASAHRHQSFCVVGVASLSFREQAEPPKARQTNLKSSHTKRRRRTKNDLSHLIGAITSMFLALQLLVCLAQAAAASHQRRPFSQSQWQSQWQSQLQPQRLQQIARRSGAQHPDYGHLFEPARLSTEPEDQTSADETTNASGANEDETPDDSHEAPAEHHANPFDQHAMQLRAMRDMFERRQLVQPAARHHSGADGSTPTAPLQSSQELSPISIGLDPSGPFGLGSPFTLGAGLSEAMPPPPPPPQQAAPIGHKPPMANADNLDSALPFGLSPLPHLLGFQGGPSAEGVFDGPQRGDQSAHSNHHATAPAGSDATDLPGPSQKVWPKIFRFTDGRINLSDFEKQKKIRLSNKNQHGGENHIESAPIMFDGRQLKRKSFLILHGGIFSRR